MCSETGNGLEACNSANAAPLYLAGSQSCRANSFSALVVLEAHGLLANALQLPQSLCKTLRSVRSSTLLTIKPETATCVSDQRHSSVLTPLARWVEMPQHWRSGASSVLNPCGGKPNKMLWHTAVAHCARKLCSWKALSQPGSALPVAWTGGSGSS